MEEDLIEMLLKQAKQIKVVDGRAMAQIILSVISSGGCTHTYSILNR
jgi:hypothetical protein